MRWPLIFCILLTPMGCDGTAESPSASVQDIDDAETTSIPADDDASDTQETSSEEEPVDPWKRVRDRLGFADIGAFSFTVGTAEGVAFTHHKGGSTATTPYASASAIKWVTAAVVLSLVEEGILDLDANPQQYLEWWTADPTDARSGVTIRQLLSFTSGLSGMPFGDGTPACLGDPDTTIDACAEDIYRRTFDFTPGEVYFYGPSHMQILAAIAQAATGESWVDIYQSRVAQPLGMNDTHYNWPSLSNPRLSAGATTTMQDFQRFAEAMLTNSQWPTTWNEMVMDHTPNDGVTMRYTPMSNPNRGWHYGLGVWLECLNPEWEESCNTVGVVSASGMFGFHLWVDTVRGHYAVLAMEDQFNGWYTSLQLSLLIREDVAAALLAQ